MYHDNGGGGVGALPRPSDSAALAPLGGPPNPVQQYVDQRQQQVTEALVDLLAGSLLDPGLVDTREFRRLLSLLDSGYEPPSASQLVYGLLPGGLRGFFGVFLGCAMVPGRHHWLLRLQHPHSGSLDFPPRTSHFGMPLPYVILVVAWPTPAGIITVCEQPPPRDAGVPGWCQCSNRA